MMWHAAKQEIARASRIAVAGLFSLAVITLVLINVFGLSTDDFKSLFGSGAKSRTAKVKPITQKPKDKSGGREVRQYSEFVTVNHPRLSLTITTGIQFDNSSDQNVTSQWCYAQRSKGKSNGYSVQFNIQKINNGKVKTFAPYSVQTLREFALTQAQAKDLVRYCRFK